MPLASISKVTSICGIPRGAGGRPSSRNLPRVRLSRAIGRSPCRTWTSTAVCASSAVLNVSVLRVGMVVLRWIRTVFTPPRVSMPRESGVTSRSTTSRTSPASTPAWIAAPTATTSSGWTSLLGSLPVRRRTSSWTLGIRVAPPTRITSLRSFSVSLASARACLNGPMHRSTRSAVSSSNFARVSTISRCLGPEASAVTNGRLIDVWTTVLSSIFARSAASRSR